MDKQDGSRYEIEVFILIKREIFFDFMFFIYSNMCYICHNDNPMTLKNDVLIPFIKPVYTTLIPFATGITQRVYRIYRY